MKYYCQEYIHQGLEFQLLHSVQGTFFYFKYTQKFQKKSWTIMSRTKSVITSDLSALQ